MVVTHVRALVEWWFSLCHLHTPMSWILCYQFTWSFLTTSQPTAIVKGWLGLDMASKFGCLHHDLPFFHLDWCTIVPLIRPHIRVVSQTISYIQVDHWNDSRSESAALYCITKWLHPQSFWHQQDNLWSMCLKYAAFILHASLMVGVYCHSVVHAPWRGVG